VLAARPTRAGHRSRRRAVFQ